MADNSIIENPDRTFNVILDETPPIIFNTAPENITNNMQISAEYNDNPGGSGIDTGSISLIIDIDMVFLSILNNQKLRRGIYLGFD